MKPTLLLVDDNEEILEFLETELNEKYTIVKAMDGEAALELLRQEVIQLVISDIMMPVMDGFELCKIIKTNFEYSHIPVILLTAKNTLQSKIQGLEIGADAYIEKPFSPEYLQVQIANLLTNRAKIKEYFVSSPLVHIKSMAHTKTDELFLEKVNEAVYANLEDAALDVEKLAKLMNMSKPTLYRKIKSISDLTPNELINITRLKKAAELLVEGKYKIYEVADMTGYGSQTNFGRNFLKQFGMTPTDYLAMKQAKPLSNDPPE
ncbi:MAG: DNA-binding response regulator [Ferruginibacter sp.]|uniref:response regulator n=1 Tax=Ferruginibacter sp. TaxID=1940288 RepID=UPI00265975F4|nr:response regulator [Ferruginibacter sp.]MDB5275408.1 DNA-binding response regulator [Ferruginibacter sp.]